MLGHPAPTVPIWDAPRAPLHSHSMKPLASCARMVGPTAPPATQQPAKLAPFLSSSIKPHQNAFCALRCGRAAKIARLQGAPAAALLLNSTSPFALSADRHGPTVSTAPTWDALSVLLAYFGMEMLAFLAHNCGRVVVFAT